MLLEEQIRLLDETLIGTVETEFPSPLTDAEKAKVRAFLVLSHAVLEEYVELAFERHFDRLCDGMKSERVPSECVRFAFAVGNHISAAEAGYKNRDTVSLIDGLGRTKFRNIISSNHGLKSSNVQGLAKGVGLHWPSLEDSLNLELNDLDTLGIKRGTAGHLSPFTDKATQISNTDGPDDVRSWVYAGVSAVDALTEYLVGLFPNLSTNTPVEGLYVI